MCRSLHQILATKEQNGPSEVKEFLPVHSNALGAFEHNCDQTQGLGSNTSPSQPASHVDALAGPTIPLLLACAMAVIRVQTWSVHSNASISAFERMTCIQT
jgi:hypothetical protein